MADRQAHVAMTRLHRLPTSSDSETTHLRKIIGLRISPRRRPGSTTKVQGKGPPRKSEVKGREDLWEKTRQAFEKSPWSGSVWKRERGYYGARYYSAPTGFYGTEKEEPAT